MNKKIKLNIGDDHCYIDLGHIQFHYGMDYTDPLEPDWDDPDCDFDYCFTVTDADGNVIQQIPNKEIFDSVESGNGLSDFSDMLLAGFALFVGKYTNEI